MKTLINDELLAAEQALLKHIPKSLKVYGYLYAVNRKKTTLEVVVDSWPDFKVIICRPEPKYRHILELRKQVSCYSTDDQILKRMLADDNVINWSAYFVIGGLDLCYAPMLKELSSHRNVNIQGYVLVHLMYLPDTSYLLTPAVFSELESRISSLELSHVDLVNNTWKFGGNEKGYNHVKYLISNFPSCCITDEQGQPVSWVLLYDYCAMGLLYTLPEHRGKGYAKVLVSAMSKRLSAEGFPIYCFIEEDNVVSHRLFESVGFIEDHSYRAGWFKFNF